MADSASKVPACRIEYGAEELCVQILSPGLFWGGMVFTFRPYCMAQAGNALRGFPTRL